MVIGFKDGFVEPILTKSKKHTIRADTHNRWKEGMKMHMATGVRTRAYKQFGLEICRSIQKIEIKWMSDYTDEVVIKVDGRRLSDDEIQSLAYNDGFDTLFDFLMWFRDGFEGKILHWTELRY